MLYPLINSKVSKKACNRIKNWKYWQNLPFFILFVCIWHEDSVVSMSNFGHRDNFSSSIDWQCQKWRKHCAIGSKVKNTVKFSKISVGDDRP